MKLTTFLTALACLDFVTASPAPTGLSAHNPGRTLDKHGTKLLWKPPNAYQNQKERKRKWEHICAAVLTGASCNIGTIHKGVIKLVRNGRKVSYVALEGASSTNKIIKKMRVYHDGSVENVEDWSKRDRKSMYDARRGSDQNQQPQLKKVLLFWDPPDTFQDRRKRKQYWEKKCDVALIKAGGCDGGTIYKGERIFTKPNGEKMLYVNVEAAPPMGMDLGKKMHVFQDGSYEEVDDWSAGDLRLMRDSKRPRPPDRRRGGKYVGPTGTSSQAHTQEPTQEHAEDDPNHRIYWNASNPYQRYPHLRQSYERACYQALRREGCHFGVIDPGRHLLKNPDGTQSFYVKVSAGKNDDLDGTRYMRLFEDGSSQWYEPGELSSIPSRPNPRPSDADHPPKRRRLTASTSSQVMQEISPENQST